MTLETITQTRAHLAAAGFAEELVVDGTELRTVSGARYRPDQLTVARLVHFRGITGPDEEAVLFALATTDGQPLGTYVPPLRPALSSDDEAVVAQLHEHVIPEAEIRAHARHDHIAAVFPDPETAEAAVAELRAQGFGSDRLGIAVHEGVSHAFERNAETELAHDIETGAAAGAAIGFVAGMSLAAVALVVPGGVIALGGIFAFGAAGGLWGAYFGAVFGEAAADRAERERDELAGIPLGPGQVLVAVCSHGYPSTVQAVMERHGGELLLRPREST
jgi:hypothetical protein